MLLNVFFKKSKLKVFLCTIVCAPLLFFLSLVSIYLVVQYDGNFHKVESTQLYRSAQLSPELLKEKLAHYEIKSILNLRGEAEGSEWYDSEIAASSNANVMHLNYKLSASTKITNIQVHQILDIIDKSPKPLLIHCQGGSDRTGLVIAAYLARSGSEREKVKEALSIRYGHFPYLLWKESIAMDESLAEYLSLTK